MQILVSLMIGMLSLMMEPSNRQPERNWACFGGDASRNNVNLTAKNLPKKISPSDDSPVNLLWKAELGTRSLTQPVLANGRILIGSNNERPRNVNDLKKNVYGEKEPIDKGIMMCFDATSGKFLWQASHDRHDESHKGWWQLSGITSTPCIDSDRAYYMSNRCELVCIDVNGPKNGINAVILWKVDLFAEYKVSPFIHICAPNPTCSPLVVGDMVYIITGNGVDATNTRVVNPDAPSFMAFHKMTGKLIWKDHSPGKGILHGQWSSPAYAATPVPQVIFPGGDGWIRAFEPLTGKLLWKFDGNPKGTKYEIGGIGDRSYFVAAPVIYNGKMLIGTGQHPEHFVGVGHLWCVDLANAVRFGKVNRDADVTPIDNNFDPRADVNKTSAVAWHYGGETKIKFERKEFKFGRTVSSVTVVGDVVYAADLNELHCLDLRSGSRYWAYDLKGNSYGSPLYADGRIYITTDGGDLFIIDHQQTPVELDYSKELAKAISRKDAQTRYKNVRSQLEDKLNITKIEFNAPIYSTPTACGDVLYVTTEKALYAFRTQK